MHAIYAFFHWFFVGSYLRIGLFIWMCLAIFGACYASIDSAVKADNKKEAIQKADAERKAKQKAYDEGAVKNYHNLTQEARAGQVAGILSALLGHPGVSYERLHIFTGLNRDLLRSVVTQLEGQGYVEVDGNDRERVTRITVTDTGSELYRQLHSGKREEIYYMGDVFNVGDNSTVVNRSAVYSSFNDASRSLSAKSKDALQDLMDVVLDSRSEEAAENLNEFLVEIKKEHPRKSILNSLLNGITASLPSMVAVSEIVDNVRQIITGL